MLTSRYRGCILLAGQDPRGQTAFLLYLALLQPVHVDVYAIYAESASRAFRLPGVECEWYEWWCGGAVEVAAPSLSMPEDPNSILTDRPSVTRTIACFSVVSGCAG